jgi:phosphoglycerate dehydrogenase-like enzyme
MPKIGILSRNAKQYTQLIYEASLPQLALIISAQEVDVNADYSQIEILLGDPDLTAQILDQCTGLIWLQSTWAGNAPLLNKSKTDYQLCGVKDVFQQAMSEYVLAYLLYFARNIEGFKRAQTSKQWAPPHYAKLAGKSLGIMGVGNIGKGVAETAKAFGLLTRGFTRNTGDCGFIDQYYNYQQLADFADGLDYLLCLLPDSKATQSLIDAQFLSYLPKHCVLINAGRGATLVEPALIEALQQNKLKAAVLDVFTQEPLPVSHPFWQLDNLFITQHTAAESVPAQISELFINNYHRYIKGQPLAHLLDFTQGY